MASKADSTIPAKRVDIQRGELLTSEEYSYHVEAISGKGTFGKVAKCTRIEDKKTVAIKMMKCDDDTLFQVHHEVAALRQLKQLDPDKCNLVRWYQFFSAGEYQCLEFEHLDKSLLDFMRARGKPLQLPQIRPMIQQVANALHHLQSIGMIHCDLKMENVMLVDQAHQPLRVKLIDFGLATDKRAATVGSYIQTRYYRAPEIILGLPYSEAIDMWSLGCIAASLCSGKILYPGTCEYDMMRLMVKTQGQVPGHMLKQGAKTCVFYRNLQSSCWRLKTPEKYAEDTGIKLNVSKPQFRSLDAILNIQSETSQHPADAAAKMVDRLMFLDLLKGMLEFDPERRLTPRQVLEHPFITMSHISDLRRLSSHVRSCFDVMHQSQNPTTSDIGSLREPTLGTSSSVQRNLPTHSVIPPPETAGTAESGVRRQMQREERRMHDTSSASSQCRYGWIRKEQAGPSTSNWTREQNHQAGPYNQSTQNQGAKRKRAHDDNEESDYNRRPHHEWKRFRRCPTGSNSYNRAPERDHSRHTGPRDRFNPTERYVPHHSYRDRAWSPARSGLKRKRWDDDGDVRDRNRPSGERERTGMSGKNTKREPDTSERRSEHHHQKRETRHSSRSLASQSGLKRKRCEDDDGEVRVRKRPSGGRERAGASVTPAEPSKQPSRGQAS